MFTLEGVFSRICEPQTVHFKFIKGAFKVTLDAFKVTLDAFKVTLARVAAWITPEAIFKVIWETLVVSFWVPEG